MHLEEEDSPPRPEEEEFAEDFDEDDMEYVGDLDEVLDELDREEPDEGMEEEEPISDDAVTVFTRHTGSVFCGSLNKDGTYAVTGGEDDKAYVWNTTTAELIHECTGHEDSIIFAEFNHDDVYLATGDMSGIIRVWKMSSKEIAWEFNMGDALWMKWHNQANILFAGAVAGEIYMWKIPSGETRLFQGFGQRSECGALAADGKKLIAGYGDGTIRVLDLKEGTVHVTIAPNMGHNDSITDLACQSDGKVIVSSGLDGKTILTTTQTGKIIGVLQELEGNNENGVEEGEDNINEKSSKGNWVESVAFCNDIEMHMIATGTVNGDVFIFDTVKQIVRSKISQNSGVAKIVWRCNSPFFFTAGLDGGLRYFDARNGEFIKELWGHTDNILDLFVSRDGKKVLTTSDDKTARIFDVSQI